MKHLHLIETAPGGLRAVRTFLEEINAQSSVYGSVAEAMNADELPDMVVLLAQKEEAEYRKDLGMMTADRVYGRLPRVVLLPISLAMKRKTVAIIEGEAEFPLPVDKLKFLSAVSKCLEIPQRRSFRIIITITLPESNLQYSGMSVDFSDTGMGFEGRFDLAVGQPVRILFVNPATKARLSLQGEVVRKTPALPAAMTLYGARFVALDAALKDELGRFISGSR